MRWLGHLQPAASISGSKVAAPCQQQDRGGGYPALEMACVPSASLRLHQAAKWASKCILVPGNHIPSYNSITTCKGSNYSQSGTHSATDSFDFFTFKPKFSWILRERFTALKCDRFHKKELELHTRDVCQYQLPGNNGCYIFGIEETI